MTTATVDDLEAHASTLAAMGSAVLLGLAHGKYDGQSEVTGKLLSELGIMLPPAAEAEKTLGLFVFLSKLTDPGLRRARRQKWTRAQRGIAVRQEGRGIRVLRIKTYRKHGKRQRSL
jgi:hypothetical protein